MRIGLASHTLCRGTGKVRDRDGSPDHGAPHYPRGRGPAGRRGPRGVDGCPCVWLECPGPHIVVELPIVLEDGAAGVLKFYAEPDPVREAGFPIERTTDE